ncbi:hypothetical protein B0T24DRAFT_598310 [Lasiosphaeria ovina]|uniref:Uncharacterized protein n=1 Tax=Lasiosphaeria ovina TaxID=92902 RepID=A0AAE0MZ68_9PEZI|nr:hypothetical protein B0T24DRAFT_598310 [Lasiosphaeria ovina]
MCVSSHPFGQRNRAALVFLFLIQLWLRVHVRVLLLLIARRRNYARCLYAFGRCLGQLVHAFSRLDPYEQPAAFPDDEELGRQTGFKHVFYWESSRCNITRDCLDPNDVLTSAFSSLGEFARFSRGIGYARLDRLQHVEITLVGNQYFTEPADAKGRIPFSRRTYALTWLPDCPSVISIVVSIGRPAIVAASTSVSIILLLVLLF